MNKEAGFTFTPHDPVLYEIVVTKPEFFSPKQLEVVKHIIAGRSNTEIASLMRISPHTVKNHLTGTGCNLKRNGIFGVSEQISGQGVRGRNRMIWNLLRNEVLELKPVEMNEGM